MGEEAFSGWSAHARLGHQAVRDIETMANAQTTNRYGTSYYVSPRRYRHHYRGLEEWERKWHRYERQHPTDVNGFPRDEHARRTISVGDNDGLEAIMYSGADGKIGDPLAGILLFRRLQHDPVDPYRIRITKIDTELLDPLPDPIGHLRICSLYRFLARKSPEHLVRLMSE